jgi:hypothetical protein
VLLAGGWLVQPLTSLRTAFGDMDNLELTQELSNLASRTVCVPRPFRGNCRIGHDGPMLAKGLLSLSSVVFAATGLAYLAAPGLALGIVGIPSSTTSDFLLRTEAVPPLFGAAMTWAIRDGGRREQRIALVALAGYYILSSVIDLAAVAQGVVGAASVPSAVIRIAIGTICVAAAASARRRSSGTPTP